MGVKEKEDSRMVSRFLCWHSGMECRKCNRSGRRSRPENLPCTLGTDAKEVFADAQRKVYGTEKEPKFGIQNFSMEELHRGTCKGYPEVPTYEDRREFKVNVISEVNGKGSLKKEGVLRHDKCHKEFREDREKSSLDSEIKGELNKKRFTEM